MVAIHPSHHHSAIASDDGAVKLAEGRFAPNGSQLDFRESFSTQPSKFRDILFF